MENLYDIIILGGGPASMSAGIYAKQMGLNVLLIEKSAFGGQITTTSTITNYLGFPVITGEELSEKMHKHTVASGIDIVNEEITKTELNTTLKVVHTHTNKYTAKAVIIGIGTSPRSLGIDNEREYMGKGISYSSLRDRDKYEGQPVAVVGGGNSALEDALYLSRLAAKVYLIHRRDSLRATKIYHEPLMKAENVEFVWDSAVTEILSDGRVTGAKVKNLKDGTERQLDFSGLFVSIGRSPATDFLQGSLEPDEYGYIKADESTRTSVPGVFAVGDVRTKALRQVVTAVADGATAVHYAEEYLNET